MRTRARPTRAHVRTPKNQMARRAPAPRVRTVRMRTKKKKIVYLDTVLPKLATRLAHADGCSSCSKFIRL